MGGLISGILTRVVTKIMVHARFSNCSLSAQLLHAVYDDLVPRLQVLDITVEDPSEEFSALRDYVDCQNALGLCKTSHHHKPFAESAEKEFRSKLKLQKV